MESKIKGSCLCGQIKFEYNGEIGPSSYCHCSDCRKVTGTAFLVSTRLDVKNFVVSAGQKPTGYSVVADSGKEIIREFCPICGSPLFTFSPVHPEYVWVKSGCLDDPTIVKPSHQSWTNSKVMWADIPSSITSYSKGCDLLK